MAKDEVLGVAIFPPENEFAFAEATEQERILSLQQAFCFMGSFVEDNKQICIDLFENPEMISKIEAVKLYEAMWRSAGGVLFRLLNAGVFPPQAKIITFAAATVVPPPYPYAHAD